MSKFKAIIDTGTSLIAGPPSIMKPIISSIPYDSTCSNLTDLPDFTATIDGIDYVLEGKDYMDYVEE